VLSVSFSASHSARRDQGTLSQKRSYRSLIDLLQPEQIQENVKAIDILHKITPEIMERINSILDNKPAVAVSSTPLCPYPVLTPQSRAMVEGARLGRS